MRIQSEKIRPLMMLFVALLSGLALVLVWGVSLNPAPAQADGAVSYVDDDTCPDPGSGTEGDPFCRIQDAVDAASDGGEIHVAAGTYTGTQMVLDSRTGYTFTQVVFITRSVKLRGGYDAADWSATPDPAANPTVIDARGYGRGISLIGRPDDEPDVIVEGFTVTGGDYTGLGNPPGVPFGACSGTGIDCGGGLLAMYTRLTLRNMFIFDNIASRSDSGRMSRGGGINLVYSQPDSLIEYTTVMSNSIGSGYGGGISLQFCEGLTLRHSIIEDNKVLGSGPGSGGGTHIFQSSGAVRIEDTSFLHNYAHESGALEAMLTYEGEALHLDRVTMVGNETTTKSAALQITKQDITASSACITNLLLAENRTTRTSDSECVIDIYGGATGRLDTKLAHVTAANNQVPTFLHVGTRYDPPTTAVLTDTLLVSFDNAFVGLEDGGDRNVVITHTNTLTHEVASLHHIANGSPTFTAVDGVSGDPMLDESYHLQAGSAAIDAGTDARVDHDIDGDPRPLGDGFDIGADEFAIYKIYLPLVLR